MQRAIPGHDREIYPPQTAAHSKELLYRHFQSIFYSRTLHGNHYRATRQPVPTSRPEIPTAFQQDVAVVPRERPLGCLEQITSVSDIGSALGDAITSRHEDIIESLLLFAKPLSIVDILLLLHHVRQHLTVPVSRVV
jgi:hypothetical protein